MDWNRPDATSSSSQCWQIVRSLLGGHVLADDEHWNDEYDDHDAVVVVDWRVYVIVDSC